VATGIYVEGIRREMMEEEYRLELGIAELYRYLELYQKLGLSMIPIAYKSKKPALPSWQEYQRRLPEVGELMEWFTEGEMRNIGIICGRVSGNLVVLDFDSKESYEHFIHIESGLIDLTPIVETGRGFQIYLHSSDPVPTFKVPQLQIDVKGEGGYVVAPPSLHPNGKKYKFINSPRQIANVGDFFDAFEKTCHNLGADIHLFVQAQKLGGRVVSYTEKAEQAPITPTPKNDGAHWIVEALQGVLEGERDDTATKLAGYFHSRGIPPDVASSILHSWAERCVPPFPPKEMEKCVKSVYKYPLVSSPDLEQSNTLRLLSLAELLSQPSCEVPYLISAIIPEGGVLLIGGEPGVGKTWLALELALSVAQGRPFLERFQAKQGLVLIIDEESGENRLRYRLSRLALDVELPIYLSSMNNIDLQDKVWANMLGDRISALKPSLVILDSLIRVHRGEENSAQDMSQLFAVLSEMRKEFGCAFAYTHHLRKRGMLKGLNSLGQRMRGSSDITAYADSILGLERVDDRLILSQLKNRDGEFIKPLALSIEDTSEERIQLKVLAEVDEEADKRKQAREMIREALTQKRLFREELVTLAKEAGISQRTLADALKDLKDCGEIQREVEGRKSIYTLMQSVQPMQ
jgi:hypothetical protein